MTVTPMNLNNKTYLVLHIVRHIDNHNNQRWIITCTNGYKFEYQIPHTHNLKHHADFSHESARMLSPNIVKLDPTQTRQLRKFIVTNN